MPSGSVVPPGATDPELEPHDMAQEDDTMGFLDLKTRAVLIVAKGTEDANVKPVEVEAPPETRTYSSWPLES